MSGYTTLAAYCCIKSSSDTPINISRHTDPDPVRLQHRPGVSRGDAGEVDHLRFIDRVRGQGPLREPRAKLPGPREVYLLRIGAASRRFPAEDVAARRKDGRLR